MTQALGKWHYRFWPVYTNELIKFLPLLLMKLLLSLNYTLLYNSKDTLIVARSLSSGAEVIPLLKGWFVIPAAFIIMILYSKLSNRLSRAGLFYATLMPFLIFFILFTFILYPNKEHLTPTYSAQWLQDFLGSSRSHWVAIYINWYNSLFYIIAELWGVVTINLLFWTFANQINTVSEAKRFYTLFSAAGDVGAMISAPVIFSSRIPNDFDGTLHNVLLWTIGFGIIIAILYSIMDRYILPKRTELNWQQDSLALTNQRKSKPSLIQSIRTIVKSRYLGHIAVLVIGYSLALNLVEVFWKAILKQAYPSAEDYYMFMNGFSFYTGLVSLLVTVFAAGIIIRKRGWHFSAQITPILVGISGILFFVFYYTQDLYAPIIALWGLTPSLFLAFYGAIQNILSKTAKYSFFDPTKEMAYIPLDEEQKTKGKAAVDVVGSRLGKSGSSWLQAFMMEIFSTNSILSIGHLIAPVIAVMSLIWSKHVHKLYKRFTKLDHRMQAKLHK